MNCPYCGKEMEKGYVDQQHLIAPLEWYSAKQEGASCGANGKR